MSRIVGHLRIEDRATGPRVWVAKYMTAAGKPTRKVLGPAWAKVAGRTERGAMRYRAADGPCPDGHLTPQAAQDLLDGLLAAEKRKPQGAAVSAAMTFGAAGDAWLDHVRVSGGRRNRAVAPATLRGFESSLAVLRREIDPATALRRISPTMVANLQARLLQPAKDRPALSRQTVRHHMVNLRAVLDYAVGQHWLPENPLRADSVAIVAQPEAHADFNVLDPEQVEAVARAIERIADDEVPTYRASERVDVRAVALMSATRAVAADVVRIAAYTGLRFGELRALRWRDVDLLDSTLHVRRNAPASAPAGSEIKAPKSSKPRSLPIIDPAAEVFARVKDRRDEAGLPTGPEDLVFSTAADGMLQSSKVRDQFYRGLKAAGLGYLREKDNPMTFHDLRHVFATIAVRAPGTSLVDVQAWMGHSDITTTQRYMHHVPRRDAARRLSAAFAEDRGAPSAPAVPVEQGD